MFCCQYFHRGESWGWLFNLSLFFSPSSFLPLHFFLASINLVLSFGEWRFLLLPDTVCSFIQVLHFCLYFLFKASVSRKNLMSEIRERPECAHASDFSLNATDTEAIWSKWLKRCGSELMALISGRHLSVRCDGTWARGICAAFPDAVQPQLRGGQMLEAPLVVSRQVPGW